MSEVSRMNPLVTVIMPVFNTPDLVARAINSVLDQTFEELELIIIDDASTDDSLAACRAAVGRRSDADQRKVSIVARKRNLGYAAATETGLSMSRGRWIWFVDGDDWAEPDLLETLYGAAEKNRAQIAISGMRVVRLADGTQRMRGDWVPREQVASGKESLRHLVRGELGAFQTNKLIQKKLWEGLAIPIGHTYTDIAMMPVLLSRAERVAYAPDAIYNYALRSSSITGSPRPSLWDRTRLRPFIYPLLGELFSPREARALWTHFLYQEVYRPLLHASAAAEGNDSSRALAEEFRAWVLPRVRWTELIRFAAKGNVATAASIGLATAFPKLHRTFFASYKRVAAGVRAGLSFPAAVRTGRVLKASS